MCSWTSHPIRPWSTAIRFGLGALHPICVLDTAPDSTRRSESRSSRRSESASANPARLDAPANPAASARSASSPTASARRCLRLGARVTSSRFVDRALMATGHASYRPILAPEQRIRRRLDRPHQHRSDLGLEPSLHHVHPVAVHEHRERPAAVPSLLGRQLRVARQLLPHAHHLLQVRRRARARELEQLRLALRRGHARQRPHLRVRDAALPQRAGSLRQVLQCPRGAHPLARRTDLDADLPGQPLSAGTEAVLPAAPAIEVGDEGHHLRFRRVDAGGQLGDAVAQPGEVVVGFAGLGRGGRRDGFGTGRRGDGLRSERCRDGSRAGRTKGGLGGRSSSAGPGGGGNGVRGCDHRSSQRAIVQ